jgi:PAS domain-containing protein
VGLTFLSASPQGMLGYSREELVNDPDLALRVLDPDFLEEFDKMGADFFVASAEAVRVSMPFLSRSGARVWMEARFVPEIAANGAVTGFVGIAIEAPGPAGGAGGPGMASTAPERRDTK